MEPPGAPIAVGCRLLRDAGEDHPFGFAEAGEVLLGDVLLGLALLDANDGDVVLLREALDGGDEAGRHLAEGSLAETGYLLLRIGRMHCAPRSKAEGRGA